MFEPSSPEGESAEKNYRKLSRHLAIVDLADVPEGKEVIAGIAIPYKDTDAFIADVTNTALESYGGATLEELAEKDVYNESAQAARRTRSIDQTLQSKPGTGGFTREQLQELQEAANRGKAKYEQRKKLEESQRRKELAQKRKSLGLKVMRTNSDGD